MVWYHDLRARGLEDDIRGTLQGSPQQRSDDSGEKLVADHEHISKDFDEQGEAEEVELRNGPASCFLGSGEVSERLVLTEPELTEPELTEPELTEVFHVSEVVEELLDAPRELV